MRGNGFIRVAALALAVPAGTAPGAQNALAARAVEAAYRAFPDLAEVDVTLWRAGQRAAPASAPLLTLSVPAAARAHVARALGQGTYTRVWRAGAAPVALAPTRPAAPTSVFWRGSGPMRTVALTFDDAPHPLYTPLLLDLLRRAGVRATFFVIGRGAEHYPYFVQDLVRAGHLVGNHSYAHRPLRALPPAEVRRELARTSALLGALTSQPVTVFRPPGGGLSPAVRQAAAAQGLSTVMWSQNPGDYLGRTPGQLQRAFVQQLRPGQIVLLHDNVDATLQALPAMIRAAQAQGYAFETVDAMRPDAATLAGTARP
ncbi:polysaccharide deacetylase family protein [Deinococcus multiflagellatus]|uniref:Polysaccharide deacetylase family protein n=1 Tax=Deinococcus multiflagellatus TaxID=1656887 RepID=A0ABW1ZK63_9DEIO